jgi:hypothetical protein
MKRAGNVEARSCAGPGSSRLDDAAPAGPAYLVDQ